MRVQAVAWQQESRNNITELYRMRGEYRFLRSLRNRYEVLRDDYDRLERSYDRLERSYEWRLGDVLLNRLQLRTVLLATHWLLVALRRRLADLRPRRGL
jgi:hypothetical protein